ncbi:dethiobiotin synthase [Brachyspira aalborgi]|uniref:Dethiobiotin synthase n=1 Tax=Brachyspira aalborgi TaxID=29522 RepID=A0AB38PXL9_9SPIR|nr:AAA family ATPase [Brachyspira aalborgi]TXJ15251.1 dethiobiotin synthase [Brachyspira aalborgi]TXJ18112.1 dethiobiotin synthase [Brachyspira aalborgi]TXJ24067.1 dethiobiotin synthase [Brachyspira aalborgi]TXJ47781.1 dethiobiotin synthase [Brachyspira aalborgi]
MKIFCIVSDIKRSGKTYLSSHIISSLKILGKKVCYYKPFVMEVKDGKLFDCEYIRNTTDLNASDIFVSYATNGNISPLHSIEKNIEQRDINDLIYENSDNYDYMVFEALSLYSPIKENYNFIDLISDIENEKQIIPVIEYNSNIIHSCLEQIGFLHQIGFKAPFIIINVNRDIFISEKVLEYIRKQISPIKIYLTEFESEIKKIEEIKYPNIIKELLR